MNSTINIKYHKIVLLVLLTITSLPVLLTNVSHYILLIVSVASIIIYLLNNRITINYYIVWMITVGLIIVLSTTWAIDEQLTIVRIKSYLINLMLFIYLSLLIKTKKDIYTALKIFIIAKLIMLMYILIIIDFSTLGVMRIGKGTLGEEWNANVVGIDLSLAVFASFVLLRESTNKVTKSIYILLIILFASITLLTGSRTAMFILFFSILLYALMLSGKNFIRDLFIYFSVFIILIYLVFNNPFFYEVLGKRLEGLLAVFTDNTFLIDNSTRTRNVMISAGIGFFKEQPFLGYGLNNYRLLLDQLIGDNRYSHNNYIELLVGIGLIGTVIYYSIFYYILKVATKKINKYTVFSIVIVVTLLIIDYGVVSYNTYYINFYICLAFSSAVLSTKHEFESSIDSPKITYIKGVNDIETSIK